MANNSTVMFATKFTSLIKWMEFILLTALTTFQPCMAQQVKDHPVIINEIMFDPGPEKEEFIEIYNNSTVTYDLNHLFFKVENNTSTAQKPLIRISTTSQPFVPGEYRVLTKNMNRLLMQFPMTPFKSIIEIHGFPALSNTGGVITLSDSTGTLTDRACFDPEMHFQLLRLTAGVSLERIDPDGASDSKANWTSAAEASGFATPGRINSQHFSKNPMADSFRLEPQQFTPDNDGKDDILKIIYGPQKPGSLMTIIIFDISGHPVRNLVTNVMLASENTFSWDGFTNNHTKAPAGIYIVYGEVYNSAGKVSRFKKTVILSTPLKR